MNLEDGMTKIVSTYLEFGKRNWPELAETIKSHLKGNNKYRSWEAPNIESAATELAIGCSAVTMLITPNKWANENIARYINSVRTAVFENFADSGDATLRQYVEANDLTVSNWDNPLKKRMLVSPRFGMPLDHPLDCIGCVLYERLGIPNSSKAIGHIPAPKSYLILFELNSYVRFRAEAMTTGLFECYRIK